MLILTIHYVIGLLLFAIAIAAIFVPVARRYVVYVLALQLVVGVITWYASKLVPPAPHYILAILVGGVWPMANALERKGRPKAVVMAVASLGAAIVAFVIYLGMHALRATTAV